MRNIATQRNLAQRPVRPAAGNGRLQRAVRRALLVGDGEVTTAQVADWGYVRRLLVQSALEPQHYRHLRRALRQIGAVPIGRAGGRGRPTIWRFKDSLSLSKSNNYKRLDDETWCYLQRGVQMQRRTRWFRGALVSGGAFAGDEWVT